MEPETTPYWLAATVALLWFTSWFFARIRRWLKLRKHHDRGARARVGELDARALLEEEGFSVTGEQVQGKWDVWVDGEPQEVEVFADYLVEQEGLVFVAEVKTGERAPTVKTAATRRQLLEYLFVFQADGLLLVNMETREIHEIQFEFGKEFKGG